MMEVKVIYVTAMVHGVGRHVVIFPWKILGIFSIKADDAVS